MDTARLSGILGCEVASAKERRMQSLWAGYGYVSGLNVTTKDGATKRLIVKEIDPPKGGGADDIGDQRKRRSYEVEAFFYGHLSRSLLASGVKVAEQLDLQQVSGSRMSLLMTDLTQDFPRQVGSMNEAQAKAAAEWLAGFHAHFWEQTRPEGVWEQGGYWYLDTRPDEFESIGGEWKRLKAAAHAIDWRVKGGGSRRFRTLLHGDFKGANILHSTDEASCAAYDFQYVGEGYGVRDLVMLLHSSLSRGAVAAETTILAHYHAALTAKLGAKAEGYTFEVMMDHYRLCVADYVRFMAGWGFWGTDPRWTSAMAKALLDELDGGKQLTPAEYRSAIEARFPVV